MPPYISSIQILNGTHDITALVDWNSINLTSVLTKEKGTFSFDILIPNAVSLPAYLPDLDSVMYVKYTIGSLTTQIFGGTITEKKIVVRGGLLLAYSFTCQDWGYDFDRKLVTKLYTNMDPRDIVLDIVSEFGGVGFTTTHVDVAGFNVTTIKFNYEQPTKAIEKLASQIGWDWYIDSNKDLHFFFAGNLGGISDSLPAPFDVDDTSGQIEWPKLSLDLNTSNLKNSIYVIGGTYDKVYDASNAIDRYTTVAGTFVYPIAYPYTKDTVQVTLDAVSQTVGTDNQTDPATVQVLYNEGNLFVRFTSDPGSGHLLKVFGKAQIPVLAHLRDEASISLYGEVQDAIINQQIKSVQEAQERAFSELVQFSKPVYNLQFTTISSLSNQLAIGQKITFNSTKFGINQAFVIKHMVAKMRTPKMMEFQLQCIGADKITFTDIMLFLLQQTNAQTGVADSTVLQIILTVPEPILVTDDTIISGSSHPHKWGPNISPLSRWNFFSWN